MNPLKQLFSALSAGTPGALSAMPAASLAAEWLTPLSQDFPCGDSLEYDTEYAVLQARLAPKADVQYGQFLSKPEAPDWVEVERDARRLLQRSKDISLLVWFTRARCRLGGAHGLLEGLGVLQAVLQTYPDHVHPQLMLEGAADPAVRANALAALCDPEGLLGDVREVVVNRNTAFRLTVRDVERAMSVPRPPYAPDPEVVQRQLADLHGKGDAVLAALLACGTCLQAIQAWSRTHLRDDAPSFVPLARVLTALASFDEPPARATKLQAEVLPTADPFGIPNERSSLSLTLAQRPQMHEEREQIRALLRQVRQWIEHHEPSSPVSILIKQADRMWGKRFSEVAGAIPADLMQAWDREDG